MANEFNNLPNQTMVPNSFGSYATKRAVDISTSTELVAAKTGHSIVITDIVINKKTTGDFTFFDAAVAFLDVYIKASDNGNSNYQNHFVNPIKLNGGTALNVQLDDTNTDYTVLVTYYYQKG